MASKEKKISGWREGEKERKREGEKERRREREGEEDLDRSTEEIESSKKEGRGPVSCKKDLRERFLFGTVRGAELLIL